MSETFIKSSHVLSQLHDTPYGSGINYFTDYLIKRGYSFFSSDTYLRAARHFCYWLKAEHIPLKSVDETILDTFLYNHLKECCCPIAKGSPFRFCRPALKHFLDVLRHHHLANLPQKMPVSFSPADKLLHDFGSYIEKVHGVTPSTVHLYSRYIRAFLKEKYQDGQIELQRLSIKDVREYIVAKAKGYKPETTKSLTTSLRVFFHFLKVTYQLELSLEDAVPTVPHWKLSTIPKYLTEEQLQNLLSSFDLSTPIGLRNRAMALLMARLGLRPCEVVQLSLEDMNWRQGIIHLRKNKSRRTSDMPLIREVGEAIVDYLQKGRPQSKERCIFLTHALPVGRPLSSHAVRASISRAFKLCALSVPSYGTHVLRHTLATELLKKGATLKEIADLLRHQSIETTTIYAKVDIKGLAQVALPWPEVTS